MRFIVSLIAPCLVIVTCMMHGAGRAETADALLKKARAAWEKKQPDQALDLAGQAIALDPKSSAAYLLRGTLYGALRRHQEAVADFDKAIALAPKSAEAYDRRGSEQFMLGHITGSLADFDKFLELQPEEKPGHWRRGIALYYAGRFDHGRDQFAAYEKVDTNDVENAVWHYLCIARKAGVEKARASLLKIGKDPRVPMMQVYALFAGKAKPSDVLTAARAGSPPKAELQQRLFYAHLYLGLYYEAARDNRQAREHLTKAAHEYKVGGYMWEVARVHVELLRKQGKEKK